MNEAWDFFRFIFNPGDDYYIDAGFVPIEPRGELRFTNKDIYEASGEERNMILTFIPFTNQSYRIGDDTFTRDHVIYYKFDAPCITTLERSN